MTPERFQRLQTVLDRRQPDLTVLMEQINKSHNFSAILRNCDAVGVLEAHLVPPERKVGLHQGISAGANRWVPVHRHVSTEKAVQALRASGHRIVAAHPADDARDYREVDFTVPTAIMMGAELHGVSEVGLAAADIHVVIPMEGLVQSLNVSVATALLLFEARRQREAAGLYDAPRIDEPARTGLLFEWAYPREAAVFRKQGCPYPELDENGLWVEDE